jgi:hypothetical protein
VLHTKALPGNPYDGHTLRAAIEGTGRRSRTQIGFLTDDEIVT